MPELIKLPASEVNAARKKFFSGVFQDILEDSALVTSYGYEFYDDVQLHAGLMFNGHVKCQAVIRQVEDGALFAANYTIHPKDRVSGTDVFWKKKVIFHPVVKLEKQVITVTVEYMDEKSNDFSPIL